MTPPSVQSELAIIIPTYNRAETVGRTIESVLAAERPDTEIIVVDDGSTDRTVDVLNRYRNRISVVTFARRQGGNHARNAGATASRAPVLAFLDSDDEFQPSRPGRLIAYYKANPDIDAVLDSFVVKRRGVARNAFQPKGTFSGGDLNHLLITHAIPLTNSSVSVRRNAFDSIGGYDVSLNRHQDRDFLLRLSRGHRIALGTAQDVLKTQRADSISRQGPDSVSAIAAIAERHPQFRAQEYRDLLRYLAVRGILKMLIAGHFVSAYEEIQALRSSASLPQSLMGCLLRYHAGKKIRSGARSAAYRRS